MCILWKDTYTVSLVKKKKNPVWFRCRQEERVGCGVGLGFKGSKHTNKQVKSDRKAERSCQAKMDDVKLILMKKKLHPMGVKNKQTSECEKKMHI